MAGIASAMLRKRNATGKSSVNGFLKENRSFSYAITDGNERYRMLMCSDTEQGYELAYKAARNALSNGKDYAEGGCFWDGYDLKTYGSKSYRYKRGFRFTQSKHNIFAIMEPLPKEGKYQHIFESTAAYGKTIFWKLTKDFLKAGNKQCI